MIMARRLSGVVVRASIVFTAMTLNVLSEQRHENDQFSSSTTTPPPSSDDSNSNNKGYPFSSAGVPRRQNNRPPPFQRGSSEYRSPPLPGSDDNNSPFDPSNLHQLHSSAGNEDYLVADRIGKGYPFSSAGVPKDYLRDRPEDDDDDDDDDNNTAQLEDYEHHGGGAERRLTAAAPFSKRAASSSSSPPPSIRNFPPLRTPIVYRYYGRQKTRNAQAGSIPFILLGPNVDHWKVTGQQLSARGFNVIAVGPRDEHNDKSGDDRRHEGPGLILQLMDALRWNKVVLVGCDSESALAIQAALALAPSRVVGLILCGKIETNITEHLAAAASSAGSSSRTSKNNNLGEFELDQYLHDRLKCPFMIIWDGDTPKRSGGGSTTSSSSTTTVSSSSSPGSDDRFASSDAAAAAQKYRSVIIGGGSAPHRRRPEIFAWVLTRFVEEKFAPSFKVDKVAPPQQSQRRTQRNRHYATRNRPLVELPWRVDEMFNEESFVVFGRVAATALFYGMALKVMFYQYENIRGGYNFVTSAKRNIVDKIRKVALRVGSFFFFFRRKQTTTTTLGDEGRADQEVQQDRISDLTEEDSIEDDNNDMEDDEDEEEDDDDEEEEADASDESSGEPETIIEAEDDSETPEVSPAPTPERDARRRLFFLDHVVA